MQKPLMRKFSDPVSPTAASASVPSTPPTTMVSMKLYSCWNRKPPSSGRENVRISFRGEPCVMSRVTFFCAMWMSFR